MKVFITITLLVFAFAAQAQSKKELLAEIDMLRMQVKDKDSKISEAKQKEKIAYQKVEFSEAQIQEVKKENERVLAMVNNFTSVSLKKTANVESSLQTIKEKDAQLKVINDALEKANNDRLKTLTILKDNLGGIGKVGLQNNSVVVSIPNTDLYTAVDTDISLSEKGKGIITKIATVLNATPEYKVLIEGNSNATEFKTANATNNWDLSARQAAAIANTLQIENQLDPKRLTVTSKAENNTALIDTETRIIIDSNFDEFFGLIKDRMKK